MNPRALARSRCCQLPVVPNDCGVLRSHACIAHNRVNLLISSCNEPQAPLVEGTDSNYFSLLPLILYPADAKATLCRMAYFTLWMRR